MWRTVISRLYALSTAARVSRWHHGPMQRPGAVRDHRAPRPEPGDARSTAPAPPFPPVGPGDPRAPGRDAGTDAAHGVRRVVDAPRGISRRRPLEAAPRPLRGPHGADARHDPPRDRPGRLGSQTARPAGHGPGPEESVREAPGWRGPRRGRGDGTRLRRRATADVQGARRPPLDAVAGSGSVRARAGGADRRAARPGAAPRTVGPERADRAYLDRGLARRTAGGPAEHRCGASRATWPPSGR